MKHISLLFIYIFVFTTTNAQRSYELHNIKLPAAISWYDNQFSGMYIHNDTLYLMSESRLEDNREAILYAVKLTDLDKQLVDSNYTLPYQKISLIGMENLRTQMKAKGDIYEGLEAIVIDGNSIYLSVETTTPSNYCYLLKGKLMDTTVVMDTNNVQPLRKPTKANGEHIYNAGFETVALFNNKLHTFFEYNYFDGNNYVYRYDTALNNKLDSIKISPKLPFRITDITQVSSNHFTAINYFYKGTGDDEVYRLPANDENNRLIQDGEVYKNYIRLIDITIRNKKVKWRTLFELPDAYRSYNWEGIASYKNGYFIINDKYTPTKPYYSVLLYLKRSK